LFSLKLPRKHDAFKARRLSVDHEIMKHIGLLLICIAAIVSPLKAETVMVGLLNVEGGNFITQERVRLASAVVEGAMERFFESDHIVFDLGLPSDDETLLPDPQTAARVARTGGARYFLDMRIGSPDEDTGVPGFIAYQFIDLASDRVLTDGMIKKTEIHTEVADSIAICTLFGAMAAAEAISTIK
jgi:hypothetical protein